MNEWIADHSDWLAGLAAIFSIAAVVIGWMYYRARSKNVSASNGSFAIGGDVSNSEINVAQSQQSNKD